MWPRVRLVSLGRKAKQWQVRRRAGQGRRAEQVRLDERVRAGLLTAVVRTGEREFAAGPCRMWPPQRDWRCSGSTVPLASNMGAGSDKSVSDTLESTSVEGEEGFMLATAEVIRHRSCAADCVRGAGADRRVILAAPGRSAQTPSLRSSEQRRANGKAPEAGAAFCWTLL